MDQNKLETLDLQSPEARSVGEILLVIENLTRASRCVSICVERFPNVALINDEDKCIQNALISNAVILIMACFNKNKGYRLQEKAVYGDPESNAGKYYTYIKDLRDSYVAHTFGPMRQASCGIIVTADREIIGEANLMMAHYAFDEEIYDNLHRFIQVAGHFASEDLKKYKAEALKVAFKMSKDEIEKLKVIEVRVASPEEIRQGRNTFKESWKGTI